MKHHKSIRKLGRERGVRKALLNSLARSLVLHERITTTEAKAKELRPFVEKLVTTGRKKTLASHREIIVSLGTTGAKKMTDEIAPRYTERAGGYTRILKLPVREGDAARMAVIEFV